MSVGRPLPRSAEVALFEGSRWVVLSFALTRGLHLLAVIVLARFVTPADWGVVALANIVLGLVLLFFDVGTTTALIQTQESPDNAADCVFYVNLGLGIFWYSLIWVVSPICGDFFNDETLSGVLRVMGTFLLIMPFGSVHQALLTKRLLFKAKFRIEFSAALVGSVVSIALALAEWRVWALVAGGIATQVCLTVLAWATVPWRPRRSPFHFRWTFASRLARFGGAISVQGWLVWIVNTLDNILIGRWWKASDLGLYELGFRLGTWPSVQITSTFSSFFFPLLSRIQHDPVSVRETYLKALHFVALLTLPIGVGIALTCPLFVPFYLGSNWAASVPVIQYISVYGVLASIGGLMAPLCNALGRPELVIRYLVFSAVTAVPAYVLAVPYGIEWVATAHLLLACVRLPLDVMIPASLLHLSYRDLWDTVRVQVIACLLMGAVVALLVETMRSMAGLDDSVIFVAAVTSGCGVYAAAIYTCRRDSYDAVVEFLCSLVSVRLLAPKRSAHESK